MVWVALVTDAAINFDGAEGFPGFSPSSPDVPARHQRYRESEVGVAGLSW